MQQIQRCMVTALVLLVCTYLVAEVIASNLGTLSHLWSNPLIVVSNFNVAVPREYFVAHSGEHLSLVKFSPKFPSLFRKSIVVGRFGSMNLINIFDYSNDSSRNGLAESRVEDSFIQSANQEQLELQTRKTLETSMGKIECMQFGNLEITRITCLTEKRPIYIYFDGERKHMDDVYSVINSISIQQK